MTNSKLIEWGIPLISALFIVSLGLFASGCGGGGGGGDSSAGTAETASTPDPLSFMEQDFAHKWSRYHSFDGSYQYFIFSSDRTGCYFEISSSGSRSNQSDYAHWELNEDTPLATNVFQLVTKSSASAALYYRSDEFHYAANELWKGGYSTLKMYSSTTTRTCQ